jgi:hypothetical protein
LFARLHQVFDVEIDRRLCERDAGDPRKNDFLDLLLDTTTSTAWGRDTLLSLFTVSGKINTVYIYLCVRVPVS